jgi:hypothetical protein
MNPRGCCTCSGRGGFCVYARFAAFTTSFTISGFGTATADPNTASILLSSAFVSPNSGRSATHAPTEQGDRHSIPRTPRAARSFSIDRLSLVVNVQRPKSAPARASGGNLFRASRLIQSPRGTPGGAVATSSRVVGLTMGEVAERFARVVGGEIRTVKECTVGSWSRAGPRGVRVKAYLTGRHLRVLETGFNLFIQQLAERSPGLGEAHRIPGALE